MWPAASFGVTQALVLLAPEAGRATGVRLAPCKTPRLYMAPGPAGFCAYKAILARGTIPISIRTQKDRTMLPSPALLRRGRAPFTALLTACIALALLATPDSAIAKRSASSAHDGVKKKGVTKITYQRSSSEETTAERDRRMYRECKGMHNAGACRGYTRK